MSKEINNPRHYTSGDFECIDAIRAALGPDFICYCRGQVIKYIWRCEYKRDREADLQKAAWYARMAAGDDPREDSND